MVDWNTFLRYVITLFFLPTFFVTFELFVFFKLLFFLHFNLSLVLCPSCFSFFTVPHAHPCQLAFFLILFLDCISCFVLSFICWSRCCPLIIPPVFIPLVFVPSLTPILFLNCPSFSYLPIIPLTLVLHFFPLMSPPDYSSCCFTSWLFLLLLSLAVPHVFVGRKFHFFCFL